MELPPSGYVQSQQGSCRIPHYLEFCECLAKQYFLPRQCRGPFCAALGFRALRCVHRIHGSIVSADIDILSSEEACNTMDREIGDFLKSGCLTAEQADLIRGHLDTLLARIRPQAVPLVESFKLPDYLLNSALGRQDGEVYKALFDFALNERRWSSPVPSATLQGLYADALTALNSVTWNPDIGATASRMSTPVLGKL